MTQASPSGPCVSCSGGRTCLHRGVPSYWWCCTRLSALLSLVSTVWPEWVSAVLWRGCRSIEEERSTDTSYVITCSIAEIYNEVVRDLLSDDTKRQLELQKTASGFEIPSITQVGVTPTSIVPAHATQLACTLLEDPLFLIVHAHHHH